MGKTKFFFGAMLLALALSLASCMKYGEDDFLQFPCLLRSAGGETNAVGDTIKAPPDFVIKLWVESLPELATGKSYTYKWAMGDGTILYTPRVEHKYSTGLYRLSVEIAVSDGSAKVTKTIWLDISPLHRQDNIIMLLSSSLEVDGGYYELALLASTIYRFTAPPYTAATTPWATGTQLNWQKVNLTEFRYIEGRLYIIGHFWFFNCLQVFHFGQGTSWSYGPSSPYWVSSEGYAGEYIFWPKDGKIYNFPVEYTYTGQR